MPIVSFMLRFYPSPCVAEGQRALSLAAGFPEPTSAKDSG
jgi:hypothetical protein